MPRMKNKFFIFSLLFSFAFSSCSECDCEIVNGKPNFSVKRSYRLESSGFSVFVKDTVALRYAVTFNSDSRKTVFIGRSEKNQYGNREISWYYEETGEGRQSRNSKIVERLPQIEQMAGRDRC